MRGWAEGVRRFNHKRLQRGSPGLNAKIVFEESQLDNALK